MVPHWSQVSVERLEMDFVGMVAARLEPARARRDREERNFMIATNERTGWNAESIGDQK